MCRRLEFVRPILSPAPVALNRDSFVVEDEMATTVALAGHRTATGLDGSTWASPLPSRSRQRRGREGPAAVIV